MFKNVVWRTRHNTYRNTYLTCTHVANSFFLNGWGEFHASTLESCTSKKYYLAAVLKRDIDRAWTLQYRGNAVLRDLTRPFNLFRKMRTELTSNKYLYSVSETAQLLSVSRGTVYALMKTGQILAVYPTSKARISAEAIQRFVAKLEKEQRDLCIEVSEVLR